MVEVRCGQGRVELCHGSSQAVMDRQPARRAAIEGLEAVFASRPAADVDDP